MINENITNKSIEIPNKSVNQQNNIKFKDAIEKKNTKTRKGSINNKLGNSSWQQLKKCIKLSSAAKSINWINEQNPSTSKFFSKQKDINYGVKTKKLRK